MTTSARAVGSASGAGALVVFALRRERFALPCWLVGAGALFAMQSVSSQRLYDSPAALAGLREMMGASAAAVALGGPIRSLDTIGGEVLFEVFAYMGIVVALMNMFLIGRHTRSDEEAGRDELIRSARVGRRAPAVAALGVALIADACVAAVVACVGIATGLPIAGSILTGVAVAGIGSSFAALTTVAAQVFENPRGVYAAVSSALVAAYVLRAIGDVGDGTASWLSPFGWGQRTYPYVADRWWPVLLFVAASVALTAVAFVLLERRDFGAGLLPYRAGPATASWTFSGPTGLAWRLQRGSWLAWCVGVFGLGAAYGSFADSIADYLADNPDVAAFLPGGAADAVDSYLALTVSMTSLLATAFGIIAVLRARAEESAGHAEFVLASRLSRTRWLLAHASVAAAGAAAVAVAGGFGIGLAYALTVRTASEAVRVTFAAVAYWPAIWVVVAIALLAFGSRPRWSAVAAWLGFAYCAVALLFAESFDLPGWFPDASPFEHTPRVPLEPAALAPLLWLSALAAALAVAGLAAFRRRDIEP
ncbi:ABC transporter permease [Nocardia bovistercoris]|uniref:ABC transporter permease n=1 Tax=Nocardia bovistercoris TaxID=2785916 RepID=A0A931N6K5_9NOCA|nr:ABC transporter permease [Nocardia bovistercoris]MBH0781069.1 ABC transporter permease [Nocardia bovistercoris]